MLLLSSKNIHFIYIITFLDSLLNELQEFSTLQQTISFEIGLKCIISDYNVSHIIWELLTWDYKKPTTPNYFLIVFSAYHV